MASRLASGPSAPPTKSKPANAIDNYDVDDDPFAESGDDVAKTTGNADAPSKKRKDASSLGIDQAVSVSKKPRVPRAKLDESRLLSDNGIPKLRTRAQNLRFKGKGHEFSDTARLLSLYQLWLDDLFPKAKFLDALSMVEKAGRKQQLRVKRIQWIGEGRPGAAGVEDDNDLFGDPNEPEERDPAVFPAKIAPIFENSMDKRARTPARDEDNLLVGDDIYNASPKRPANAESSIDSVFGNARPDDEPDEDELDALMAEEEAQRTTSAPSIFGSGRTTQALRTRPQPGEDDEDDLDAIMAEAEAESLATKPTRPANSRPATNAIIDDDEDDLDALMAEAEAEESTAKKSPPQKPGITGADDGVNEDEEAAMAEMEGLW